MICTHTNYVCVLCNKFVQCKQQRLICILVQCCWQKASNYIKHYQGCRANKCERARRVKINDANSSSSSSEFVRSHRAHALSVQTSEQTTRAYLLLAQKQLQPSNRLTIAAAGARLLLANNLQPLVVVVVVLIENPFIMIRERDERTTSSSNEYKKLSAPNKSSLAELVITHKASNFCQQFDAREQQAIA